MDERRKVSWLTSTQGTLAGGVASTPGYHEAVIHGLRAAITHMSLSPDLGHLPSPGVRFLLVGVGASACGWPAYQRLLTSIPAGAPLTLVAINHVRNADRSLLPRALH
jgi:hypothetical protein